MLQQIFDWSITQKTEVLPSTGAWSHMYMDIVGQ